MRVLAHGNDTPVGENCSFEVVLHGSGPLDNVLFVALVLDEVE